MVSNLSTTILKDKRQHFIDDVQAPLLAKLIELACHYPEPTHENVQTPNSHVWLRVWDNFLSMEDNPMRLPLFKALRKLHIIKGTDIDHYYADRIQVILELWLEEVLKGNWKPRSLDYPNECWKPSPNERGTGYELLKAMYYYPDKRAKIEKILGG